MYTLVAAEPVRPRSSLGKFELTGTSGAAVTLDVGRDATAVGTITVDGGSLLLSGSPSTLNVGNQGTGNVTVKNSGTIEATDVNVRAGSTLSGNGTIEADVHNLGGDVKPGVASTPGNLSVIGDLEMSAGSIELDVDGALSFDSVELSGAASFTDGAVIFNFSNHSVPDVGETFSFLTAGGGISGFSNVNFSTVGLSATRDIKVNEVGSNWVLEIIMSDKAAVIPIINSILLDDD